MTRPLDSSVTIQISSQSVFSTSAWFGEVAAFAQILTHTGMLKAIAEPRSLWEVRSHR